MKPALPDIQFCIRLGWVKPPVINLNLTRLGVPRKIRRVRLTSTEYTRERRKRLLAAGLTTKGTPWKRKP